MYDKNQRLRKLFASTFDKWILFFLFIRYDRFFLHIYNLFQVECLCYFAETLRKYPPVMYLARKAVKNYTFEGTKISLRKGQQVFIPIYAIQHDPSIYPNPDIFDPERFSEDNIAQRDSMYYLPFGDGPRNCIGKFSLFFSLIIIFYFNDKSFFPFRNKITTYMYKSTVCVFRCQIRSLSSENWSHKSFTKLQNRCL